MDLEKNSVSRREFLSTTAIGATALAVATAGPVFKVFAKDEKKPAMAPKIFVCSVCGHLEFGSAPEFCPVCHSSTEKFKQDDNVFSEAIANYKDAGISHTPEITAKKHSTLVSEMPIYEVQVRIGKKMHPMEDAHHIRWIDCYADDKHVARMMFTIASLPAATFYIKATGSKIRAVEVCTIHGYWQAESEIA
jgi:desulfoferrodoxin-like iron-binding protein